ncbi:MAG: CHAT domain-containing protein [Magnetococcales bacterium]|nr:CHAT domain-containing protein [Magnetococcales bacterium]
MLPNVESDAPIEEALPSPRGARAMSHARPHSLCRIVALACLFFQLPPCPADAETVIAHAAYDFAPSVSRDGRLLAFVSNRSGNREIWLRDLTAGLGAAPRQLTDHPGADEEPAISPDGTRLLYVSHATDPRGDLYLLDLASGSRTRLTDATRGESAPVWSPDGAAFLYTRLAAGQEPQAVIHHHPATGKESVVMTGASSCAIGANDRLVCARDGKLFFLQLAAPGSPVPLATVGQDREPVLADIDGQEWLFFTRFADSRDEGRSTLHMARFVPGQPLAETWQLTPEGESAQHPSVAGNRMYYTDARNGDIRRLDVQAFLAGYRDATKARNAAAARFAAGESAAGLLILGNLCANPGAMPAGERLQLDLEYAGQLREAGWHARAKEVLARHAKSPAAAIPAIALPIEEAVDRIGAEDLRERVRKAVEEIGAIAAQWPGDERVGVMARMESSRLLLLIDEPLSALEQLAPLEKLKNRELRAQALFVRGKVYRTMGNTAGLRRIFPEVIRAVGEGNRWGVLAIAQAIAVAEGTAETPLPQRIAALRELIREHPDLKRLKTATLLRIARIWQEAGEEMKTVATLAEIPPDDPERGKSLWWQAERLIRLEQYAEAAKAYEALTRLAGQEAEERERATRAMIGQLVAAAVKDRELGDPKAAAKALGGIVAAHPASVEAHRAHVATRAMLGKNGENLTHYGRLLAENPRDPVLRYAHALALTYEASPDFPTLAAELTRLAEEVPDNPFFHQTLGWVHERIGGSHLEQAARAYQTALRLTDPRQGPRAEADLLRNLGNVFHAMPNHAESYRYFKRWTERKLPLAEPLENALLLRKLAESAFKTDRTQEATFLYRKAIDLLPAEQKVLRLELMERLALAFQAMGEHAKAANWFARVLEGNRELGKSDNLALLQRNIGVNLHQAALSGEVPDQAALKEALTRFLASLADLERHGKQAPSGGKGFINLVFSLGESSSGAAFGFDRTGEQKLLFGFLATTYEGLEEPGPALEYLQKKLALIPAQAEEDVAQATEKAVLLSRIGQLQFRLNRRAAAWESSLASLVLTTRLGLKFGNQVNLHNLSRIAVEQLLAGETVTPEAAAQLADRLTPEWEGATVPVSAFHTLANTAYVLVNLPELPMDARLYELKGRPESLYRRAEALLTAANGFSSRELLAHQTRIKLNRLVLATGAEKWQAAAALRQEVERLVESGWSESGWILSLLQAETAREPAEQEKQLRTALERALSLPAIALPRGTGRAQAPFLDQLASRLVGLLAARGRHAEAFAVSEQLAMRRDILLLNDQLGKAFFLRAAGEAGEELTALLQDLELAMESGDAARLETSLLLWKKAVADVSATRPAAGVFFTRLDIDALRERHCSSRHPCLSLVAGDAGWHLFLTTGKPLQHVNLADLGALWSHPEVVAALAQAEAVTLVAPQASRLPAGRLPTARVRTLAELIPAHVRQGLFHARVALTGGAVVDGQTLHAVSLTGETRERLTDAHLLIAGAPLRGLAIPVAERDRVVERIALAGLQVKEGHTAFLTTTAGMGEEERSLLAEALIFAGFAHVVLVPEDLPLSRIGQVVGRYVAGLEEAPALLALERAWREGSTGKEAVHPLRWHGRVGADPGEARKLAAGLYEEELSAAVAAQQADDTRTALARVENALALQKAAGRTEQFPLLIRFAVESLFRQEEYDRALVHQQRLLAHLGEGGEALERAQAEFTMGVLYSRLERFEPAITHLDGAIRLWSGAGKVARQAEGVATLGVVRENRGAYAEALADFTTSLDLYMRVNDRQAMAGQYMRMGRIDHLRLNRYLSARERFGKALALYREVKDRDGEARALFDEGLTWDATGDFAEAEKRYQAGRAIGVELDAPFLVATGALYLANSAWHQGEYQAALDGLLAADDAAKKAGDAQLTIMIANTRGLVYWTLNENEKALLHLQKAIDLAEKEKIPSELATSLNNKGQVLRQLEQPEEALTFFRRAKEIDTGLRTSWGLGYDHRNIGMALMQLGRLEEAEAEFVEAEALSARISYPVNQAKALLELGRVNVRLQRPARAVDFFQRAQALSRRHLLKEVEWRATAGLAALLAGEGRKEEAVRRYDEAIRVVEGMRESLRIDALRNSFQVNKQDLYREMILLLVDLGRQREAFDYLERFRSRNFIDLLANQKVVLGRKGDEAALRRVNGLFRELEGLAKEMAARDNPPPELVKKYREKQAAAEEAQLELQQRSPETSGFVSVDPITLERFEKLLDPGVGVVAYLLTEKELLVWLTRREGTVFRRVAVSEAEVTATVRAYRDRMQNLEPVEALLARLYGWLIAPVEKEIAGLRYLGIIPHEALHFLAFAALPGPGGVLVEQLPLFYSPSASAMRFAFEKRHKEKKTRVLAIGNPDLGDLNYDLPLAEFEADSIRWSFPRGEAMKGKQASKEWLVKHIGEYGIIHIAAHGDFQNINPLFSSLWLASGEGADSGRLTVKEIFALDLQADLVTLSACQTGLGQLRGSELIGLNRAFLYAGTHSLISSLWRVDDLSTAVLMKHFYRNYASMPKADSLRQAQLLVKQNFPHPANWAGFNLVGDYR